MKLIVVPRRDEDEPLDKYIQYVSKLRGTPDDFEDWAVDNNVKLPAKKKTNKPEDNYDDTQ
jgi:hypothetical protein